MSEKTQVQVTKNTRKRLKEFKVHRRDTYEDIVSRLIQNAKKKDKR